MKRLKSLQILRAVAAWMVVYHHYMQLFHQFHAESAAGRFFTHYGAFGVDLFFVISGYCMFVLVSKREVRADVFLVKRIFRIVPAYWVFTLITIAFVLLFPVETAHTRFTPYSIVCSLLFIPHANPSGIGDFPLLTQGWSLIFEMFFYSLLAVCIAINARRSLFLCFLTLLVLPLVWPASWPAADVLGNMRLYGFAAGLSLGFLASRPAMIAWSKQTKTCLGVACLISAIACLISVPDEFGARWIFWAPGIVFGVVLLEDLLSPKNMFVRLLTYAGDASYSTYLCHALAMIAFRHFFAQPSSPGEEAVLLIGLSAVIWLVSIASLRWIENSPAVSSLSGRLLLWMREKPVLNGIPAVSSAD